MNAQDWVGLAVIISGILGVFYFIRDAILRDEEYDNALMILDAYQDRSHAHKPCAYEAKPDPLPPEACKEIDALGERLRRRAKGQA